MEKHRSELRKMLRKRRQTLSADQQVSASKGLYDVLKDRPELSGNQHFALYLANDGEINPLVLQEYLWQSGKHCYLPMVHQSNNELSFIEYQRDTPLLLNRFGIPEPFLQDLQPDAQQIAPEQLDIVFVPLTGFDEQGRRLGMGGGFYDRTFACTHGVKRPLLIGLAHECQKVDSVPVEYWDIPMAGIATDRHYYCVDSRELEAGS